MAKTIKVFLLGSFFLSLPSFAACYGVRIWPPEKTGKYAVVSFNGLSISGLPLEQPPQKVCKSVPETVQIEYSKRLDSGADTGSLKAKQPIYVRRNMPKGFLKNPARLIEFQVHEDGTTSVLFRMKLSEITTKFISHEETEVEKKQRLNDEMLWMGIENNDIQQVRSALANNANLEQLWMRDSDSSHQRAFNVIFNEVMRSRNPDIVDLILKKMLIFTKMKETLFYGLNLLMPLKKKILVKCKLCFFNPENMLV